MFPLGIIKWNMLFRRNDWKNNAQTFGSHHMSQIMILIWLLHFLSFYVGTADLE